MFKRNLGVGSIAIVGALSTLSSMSSESTVSPETEFRSLQYALFSTCFVEVLGGLFFLLTALHVVDDRAAAERQLQGDVQLLFIYLNGRGGLTANFLVNY